MRRIGRLGFVIGLMIAAGIPPALVSNRALAASEAERASEQAQNRNHLIGTWYGEQETEDGELYLWITQRRPDGTYRVQFRFGDKAGRVTCQTEFGYWGVSGPVYFTMFTHILTGDVPEPVDRADASHYDAYENLELTDMRHVYRHYVHDRTFEAKKVEDGFDFPADKPGCDAQKT